MSTKSYNRFIPAGVPGTSAGITLYASCNGVNTAPSDRHLGLLSENSYAADYRTTHNGPIFFRYPSGLTKWGDMIGLGASLRVPDPPQPSNIKAYANLLEKYKQSDFNLAVTAGESREAWHMIADRMFSVASAARFVKRGQLSNALRALGSTRRSSRRAQRKLDSGDLSGSFLELHYGWAPLLNDIYSASEVINKPYVQKPSIRTSDRGKGSDLYTPTASYNPYAYTKVNERAVYHIARLSSKEISMAVRLGLTNPLAVAWELVPYSFVVDWFLPVGDFLSALEATYVIPIGKYIRTDVKRWEGSVLMPVDTLLPTFSNARLLTAGVFRYKGTQLTRTISSALPNQLYTGTGPRQSLIDLDQSLSQVMSAGALLHQALKRLK